jgi:hypothetical protein
MVVVGGGGGGAGGRWKGEEAGGGSGSYFFLVFEIISGRVVNVAACHWPTIFLESFPPIK